MSTAATKPRKPTLVARLAAAEAERDELLEVASLPAILSIVRTILAEHDSAMWHKRPTLPSADAVAEKLKRYEAVIAKHKGGGR